MDKAFNGLLAMMKILASFEEVENTGIGEDDDVQGHEK